MKTLGFMAGTTDETFRDAMDFLVKESPDGILRFPKTIEAAIFSRTSKGASSGELILCEVFQDDNGIQLKKIRNLTN